MSYRDDFKIGTALHSLYEMGRFISDRVFTGGRPQAVCEQMDDFVVVSIPTSMESLAYGGGYGSVSGVCHFELYARLKKSGVEDVAKTDSMTGGLLDMLPYRDDAIQVSRPQVTLKGNDGLGFSVVLVRAELLIK